VAGKEVRPSKVDVDGVIVTAGRSVLAGNSPLRRVSRSCFWTVDPPNQKKTELDDDTNIRLKGLRLKQGVLLRGQILLRASKHMSHVCFSFRVFPNERL
jgi:hypothetical protein